MPHLGKPAKLSRPFNASAARAAVDAGVLGRARRDADPGRFRRPDHRRRSSPACRPSRSRKPGRRPTKSSRASAKTSSVFSRFPARSSASTARPAVMLVVGVNGSGKTTTIGKLATRLRNERQARAARRRRHVSRRGRRAAGRSGPSAAAASSCAAPRAPIRPRSSSTACARRRRAASTSCSSTPPGGLQTKTNLMEELKKMRRVIERELGEPPAETLLVVDGTNGQNAISQAKLFNASDRAHRNRRSPSSTRPPKAACSSRSSTSWKSPIKFVGLGEVGRRPAPLRRQPSSSTRSSRDPKRRSLAENCVMPPTWHSGLRA